MKQAITLLLLLGMQAITCADQVKPAPTCPDTLKICKTLVDSQNELITQLNANEKAYKKNLEAQEAPLIPTWALVGAALVVGVVGGKVLLK